MKRLAGVVMLAGSVIAQTPAPPIEFEVATIKPNFSDDRRIQLSIQPGGRFVASGVTLKLLMSEAYNIRNFQIFGGPGWINSERWDIVAKAEGTDRITEDQFRPTLRALIEDRFQLKVTTRCESCRLSCSY